MPTRNVNLTEHLDQFIERGVAAGQYGNASEVVREALRLLEARDAERAEKLKLLRKAAKAGFVGFDQGEGIVLDGDDAIDAFLDDVASRNTSRRGSK